VIELAFLTDEHKILILIFILRFILFPTYFPHNSSTFSGNFVIHGDCPV
jgi:hypothetical protein